MNSLNTVTICARESTFWYHKSLKKQQSIKSRVMTYILNMSACSYSSVCKLVESMYVIVQRVNPFLPRQGKVHLIRAKRAVRVTFVPFYFSFDDRRNDLGAPLHPWHNEVKQMCGKVIFSIISRVLLRIKRGVGSDFCHVHAKISIVNETTRIIQLSEGFWRKAAALSTTAR